MEKRKTEKKIKRIRRKKSDLDKGVDTLKFCGVLKFKEEPQAIQQRLRGA